MARFSQGAGWAGQARAGLAGFGWRQRRVAPSEPACFLSVSVSNGAHSNAVSPDMKATTLVPPCPAFCPESAIFLSASGFCIFSLTACNHRHL